MDAIAAAIKPRIACKIILPVPDLNKHTHLKAAILYIKSG